MFAATWPTICRSAPVTVMCVCLSTATSMPVGDREHHRVRVAEGEVHFLALQLGAVADADDVELLLEARRSRPVTALATRLRARPWNFRSARRPRARAWPRALRRPWRRGCRAEPPAAACPWAPAPRRHRSSIFTVTPFGSGIGFLPIRDMVQTFTKRRFYQTVQSTSPPTPAFLAARPVMTPRDVVRMLVPRPPSTVGTSSTPK